MKPRLLALPAVAVMAIVSMTSAHADVVDVPCPVCSPPGSVIIVPPNPTSTTTIPDISEPETTTTTMGLVPELPEAPTTTAHSSAPSTVSPVGPGRASAAVPVRAQPVYTG